MNETEPLYQIIVIDGHNAAGLAVSSTVGTPIPTMSKWRFSPDQSEADKFDLDTAATMQADLKVLGFTTALRRVVSKLYKNQIQSQHVVAIKKNQHQVNAPDHETWGTVKCKSCSDEFLIGPPRLHNASGQTGDYVERLIKLLANEHSHEQQHPNSYDLGA
jgi:hypothetical protein